MSDPKPMTMERMDQIREILHDYPSLVSPMGYDDHTVKLIQIIGELMEAAEYWRCHAAKA